MISKKIHCFLTSAGGHEISQGHPDCGTDCSVHAMYFSLSIRNMGPGFILGKIALKHKARILIF
jgi:hypothetical protein